MTSLMVLSSDYMCIVRQVGSFMNSLCFACYINVILISLTRRQAAVAGKEAGKIVVCMGGAAATT
jgi:hypothetical protein